MFSPTVWRRYILVCCLCSSSLSFAQIADRFTVVIDSDQNSATGCNYTLASGQTVNGVEQLIHLDVVRNGAQLEVRNVRRQVCSGGTFGAPTLLNAGGWSVGLGTGEGGADVVEAVVPLELFRGTDRLRLVLESVADGGDYDVVLASSAPGADPSIFYFFPEPIPTLGGWMMMLYIVLMIALALYLRRKNIGPGAQIGIFLLAMLLLGFGRNIILDGQVGDWLLDERLALDPVGDTPGANPRADIVAFYACDSGASFFFRFDVSDLEVFGPDAVADTATTDEETPVSIAVLANDTDGHGGAPGANVTLVGVESQPANGTAVAELDQTITYTPAADFVGDDTFTYRVRNADNEESIGTVTVTVNNTPDAPTPVDDTATTDEDSAVDIDVLANDTDPDPGDTLTIVAVATPANGTTQITAGQQINYSPNADFNGSDTFTYTVQDAAGAQTDATVTVTVNPVNDPPQAVDDAMTVTDAAVNETLDVLANDLDAPDTGETLTITAVGTPSQGGTVNIINSGTALGYTPPASFLGTETFTYDIDDGNGGTDQATVTITVVPDNNPPVAGDDAFTVAEDSSNNAFDVLANDTTAPDVGETLTINAVGATDNGGTVVINGGTSLTYTPAANFAGTEVFTYTIDDGNGLNATGTVTVTVTNSADPPSAVDDAATVNEDDTVLINVLANDSDPDPGDTLTITVVGVAANGNAMLEAGQIRYTPNADYNGADSFTYMIEDSTNTAVSATVNVTVTALNDPPTAVADTFQVTDAAVAAPLEVLANDSFAPDTGETLTVTAVSATTQGGTVAIIDGGARVAYTPPAAFLGDDTFTYDISDGNGGTAQAGVTVTVVPDNNPPTINDDALAVNEDSSNNDLDVLANDSTAPDVGETLTIESVGATNNGGVVSINGGTSLTYTPAPDFFGTETFTYTANDGNGLTGTATVTVTVNNVNDPPTAVADSATVAEDSVNTAISVLANDSFAPDVGETLAIGSVGVPDNGGAAVISGTDILYTPAANFFGTETFTYNVSDGNGGSDTATVTVTVTAANDDPTAADDAVTVAEDSGVTNLTVLANDSDAPDTGETLTITAVGATNQGGSAVIAGGSTSINYTPAANFFGTETFTYTISDGNGGNATATVTATVTPVNDDPTAVNDTFGVNEDDPVQTLTVLANDQILPDTGETLTVTAVGATDQGGTAVVSAGGVGVDYTPALNFFGTETFTYTISDGNGGSDTATVTVNIASVNDPPIADNETYNLIGNTLLHINSAGAIGTPPVGVPVYDSAQDHLLIGDSDPEAETISVTAGTFATVGGGSITLAADGSFSYRPPAGATTDSYTYTVNDTSGGSSTGTITFNMATMIWYFDDTYGGTPAGTSSAPFNSMQDMTMAPFADNHIVFVFEGSSTTPGNEWDGLWQLRPGMRLIGEGIAFAVDHPDTVGTLNLVGAGTAPVLTNAGGDILQVTDAAGVVIEGLDLRDAADNGLEVTANTVATDVTMRNCSLSGHAGEGIFVNNNHTGDMTVVLDTNSLSSVGDALNVALSNTGNIILQMDNHAGISATGGAAVSLNGSAGAGTLFVTSFSGNSIAGTTSGAGLVANTVTFDADTAFPLTQMNLGTLNIGSGADSVGGTAVSLTNVSGSLAFDNLNLYSASGGGLVTAATSVFDANTGGLRLQSTAGEIVAALGPAVALTASTAQLDLTNITSTGSTSTGLSLNGVAGAFNITGDALISGTAAQGVAFTNISAPVTINRLDVDNTGGVGLEVNGWSGAVTINNNGAGSDISNTTGNAVDLNLGSANLTYAGTVANTANLLLDMTGQNAGTVTFSNSLTSNGGGGGINLANNTGGTLALSGSVTLNTATLAGLNLTNNSLVTNITGNLDIDTTSALGVNGSSGGTLSINGGVNTLNTTNGQALALTNTTLGGNGSTGGVVWQSINSSGGATGISLNNTGTGRFVVTGVGTTDATGGTIQNKTGRGAEFISANNITLTNMDFTNTASTDGGTCTATETGNTGCNAAVHMQTVTGITLENINTSNGQIGINGNGVTDFVLNNSSVTGHGNGVNEHGVRLINLAGTSALTSSNVSSNNRFNVFILNNGTTNLTSLNVTGCTFNLAAVESGFKYEGNNSAQATLTMSGNTVSNNNSGAILIDTTDTGVTDATVGTTTAAGNADFLQMSADGGATVTYDIHDNTSVSSVNGGLSLATLTTATSASLSGRIRNNVMATTAGTTDGLRIIAQGASTLTTSITNNTLNYNGGTSALVVSCRDGSASLAATITGNDINSTDALGFVPVLLYAGVLGTDSGTLCLEFSGNDVDENTGGFFEDVYVRQRGLAIYQIEGLGASGVTNAATVQTYVAGQNPLTDTIAVLTGGSNIVDYDDPGGSGCANP